MELKEFKSILMPLREKMFNHAKNMLTSEADAEDAVQEAFLRLWNVRSQLDHHINVPGFAIQTVKNLCIDKLRRKQTDISLDCIQVTDNKYTPYIYTEEKDSINLIKKIIDTLPGLQQRVIHMRDIEGYELNEIAEITGCEVSAVTMNLSRARKKVRDKFIQLNQGIQTSN